MCTCRNILASQWFYSQAMMCVQQNNVLKRNLSDLKMIIYGGIHYNIYMVKKLKIETRFMPTSIKWRKTLSFSSPIWCIVSWGQHVFHSDFWLAYTCRTTMFKFVQVVEIGILGKPCSKRVFSFHFFFFLSSTIFSYQPIRTWY